MKARLAYLDNLKVLLTALVILLHASAAYGGPTNFTVKQPADSALATGVLAAIAVLCQPFILGCYFFIAGYLTPPAQARHGAQFLRHRLVHLGLPLLAYDLIGERLQLALVALAEHGWPAAVTTFCTTPFELGSGPLWFVERLLVFTLLWALVGRQLMPWLHRLRPTLPLILGGIAGVGLVSFLIRVVCPFYVSWHLLTLDCPCLPLQYPLYFLLGVTAYENEWLARLDFAQALTWLLSAGLSLGLFFAIYLAGGGLTDLLLFASGWHWQSLVAAVWEQGFGLALTVGLLGLFRRYADIPWPGWLSRSTFTVYVIHAPVLVAVWLWLEQWPWPSLAGFALTSGLTLVLSWTLSASLTHIFTEARR
ncbi:MAG TPA: acyltransferase [Anaerolineae bacterium]|nr:acyltransferase [Anaerolineae bacterium]